MADPAFPSWTTIGFTGHRQLENSALTLESLRSVLGELAATFAPLAVVTSAASGADTLFLEEIKRRDLPFFLILPFSRDRFLKDFSPAEWDRVVPHFDRALRIDEVSDVESASEGYLECGVRTVDRSDLLLAIWNGQPAAGRGGTAEIVAYARALAKPLVWVDSGSGEIHRERLESLPSAGGSGQNLPVESLRDLVHQLFVEFDSAATARGPAARQLTLNIIRLHLLASALGAASAALGAPAPVANVITAFKLGALVVSLVLGWRHRSTRQKWIRARVAAEICRSYLAIWPMRRQGAQFSGLAVDADGGLARNIQMAWYLDKAAERRLEEARDDYATNRVRGQLDYFERQYKSDGQKASTLKTIATSATIAAIVTGLTAAIMPESWIWAYKSIKLLAILLPLVPPALLSIVLAHDLARRADRFRDITENLRQAEQRLRLVRTWPSLWREVAETEDLLLREVAEWHSLARYAAK